MQVIAPPFRYKSTLLVALIFWAVAGAWVAVDPSTGLYLTIVALVTTLILALQTDIIYVAFVISLVMTSFYAVELGGSYLRIPFILNLFVILFLPKRSLVQVMKSRTVIFIGLYIIWTLFVTFYHSANYVDSLRVSGLPILLLLIAINVAAIIGSGRLPLKNTLGLLLVAAGINLIMGIVQYVGYIGFGADILNLTEQQWQQISLFHRMTATFWEGDTYGKYLMALILLMLPLTVEMYRKKQRMGLYITLFAFLSLMLNQTRSAWVGLAAGLSLFVLFGKIDLKKKVLLLFTITMIATVVFSVITTFEKDSQIRQRIQALASFEKMREDPSAAYRIKGVEDTWNLVTSDAASFFFGRGFVDMGEDYKGASNIFLHVIVTSGIVGLVLFALSFAALLHNSLTCKSEDAAMQLIAKGVGLAMVGMLVASQLAPMLIDPVFWMVAGLGIYNEVYSKKMLPAVKRYQEMSRV